jgi:predicted nuclease with RNAse H fold
VITAGIDLAASPATTGLAVLSGRRILELDVDVDDRAIVDACDRRAAVKIGIDCPLGWPRAFVAMLADPASPPPAASVADRDRLAYRETDRRVRTLAPPLRPLSVSADRIAHAAFRCAGLLPRLGQPVDRTGRGRVVETYPAGSLRRWGLPFRRYKGADGQGAREQIVDALAAVLDVAPHRRLLTGSDHALDAVVAALTARAAVLGKATLPGPDELAVARDEGWIALPTCELDDLGGDADPGTIEQIRPY